MPIDAGLLTALPVPGSGSSTDYASVLAQQSGAPADVVHAILGTEQSAPNATSVDNARGRMQVTPAAWSQYGIPGVDFGHATPDQLDIAGAKKLADDYKWSGGNPQITAAAYFGGRGGATLFAQGQGATRQDGNGFNINQYVDRFNQKLGSAPARQSLTANTSVGQTASDVDAARQRAKGATLGDALKEVLASGTSAVGDIAHAGGEVLAAGANAATGLPDYSGFNPLKGSAESIRSTMTPGGTAAREDQATGDLDPATWQFPKTASGWVMSAANTFGSLAPALIPMIGPAARAAKLYEAGSLALKTAQAAGDIEGISAAQKMLSEASSAGMQAKALSGAVEGGMTGGNAAEGTRDDVRQQLAQMTHDQRIQKIPAYAQAFRRYGNDNDAGHAVENSAAQFSLAFAATAGGVGGVFNEKVLEDLIAHKGLAAVLGNLSDNRAVRTAVGATVGHVAEAGQEAGEQGGQNVGENIGMGVDPFQNAGKDMFPNMLGGALIGTPMGAIGGLTSHGTHANGEIHPDVAQTPENVPQNTPITGESAIPVAQNAASVSPPPTSFDQLSQQRDQLSARIATLQDVGQRLQGTQSQAAVENEIVGLQQQQRALGEQMQAAVSTGAANPAAAPTPVNDPEAALQTRTRVITDFVADKSVSRELRTQDPQAWSEFLRAYRVALNPTMSPSLRLRALDGIDGYLQQQGFKTSAQGAYERVQQAQPTPANIVPYGANQAELQRGDPQGRMVVDADGNARPASINDVPQPDQNVVPGQVLSSSEGPAPVAPLRADANGVVGTANDFTQLRQQEAQAAATVKRNAIEEALRPRALPAPTLTDAQAASLKQPSALVQEIRAFRLKNSPAMQVEPAATTALTQENENGRKTQTEDQTQANAASGKAETNANALLTPETTNAVTVDEAAHQAASSPLNALPEPTEAQKHAGNYPMGHIRVSGMDISIENPQGSVRSGTDANGKAWSNTLAAHYGYLRGTVGKDKDHIDVFVKPATVENHDGPVFVIDQRKPGNGHLDEHKVMMGFANEGEARKAYQDSYQKGWDGIRAVTEMTTPGFKDWIANGDHTKPAAEYAGNSSEKPNSSTAYKREAAVKTLSDTYTNKGADAAAEQFKQIIKDNALSDDEWKALRSEFKQRITPATPEPTTVASARANASFDRQSAGVKTVASEMTAQKINRALAKKSKPLDLLTFINQNGGIALSLKRDIDQDVKRPGLFRHSGRSIDSLSELLQQHGYITQAQIDAEGATSGGNTVIDMLQRAVGGEKIYSLNDVDEMMSSSDEAQYRDAVRREASESGIKSAFRPFSAIEGDLMAMRERKLAAEESRHAAHEQDAFNAVLGDLRALVHEDVLEGILERVAIANEDATISEYHAAVISAIQGHLNEIQSSDASQARQVIARPAEKGGRVGDVADGLGRNQENRHAFALEAQTAESLKAKTGHETDQRLADKALADSQRSAFTLEAQPAQENRSSNTGDMFGGPSVSDYSIKEAGARARKNDSYTKDLFGEPLSDSKLPNQGAQVDGIASSKAIQQAGEISGARFATIAGPRQVGVVKSAFERVDDAQQAAHVLAGLRKLPQEHFQILVLDSQNKPISILNLFAGATTQASVYPEVVTKAVYEVPGAARIWYAHNHPSGNVEPSKADVVLTSKLSQAFGYGTGVDVAGRIIIAGSKYSELDAEGGKMGWKSTIPAGVRKYDISVTERVFRKIGTLGEAISTPTEARQLVPDIANKQTGIIFLNAQNGPVAFVPMQVNQMQKLRDGSSARVLFGAVARANAVGAIVNFAPGETDANTAAAVRNLYEALTHRDVKLLDAFHNNKSMSEQGNVSGNGTGGVFMSRTSGEQAARELFASPDPQSSVEDVRSEITGEVGDKADKVHVVQSITDLPTQHRKDVFESKALDLQGLYDPKDGSIYLVADNIHKGEAFGVLMHEAGVHLGMRELIGDDAMGALAKQIKLWSALEKGTEHGDLAARAMERIPEETDPAHRDEELIAYFVTEAVKAGHGDTKQGPIGRWFAKLWAAVKVAVAKLGADPSKLTTADVVAMARGALERSLGKESAREGEAMASAKPSELRKTPIVKDNRVNATFTALAKFDEAFQQPTPTATDPVKIAKQIDPGFKVEKLNDFFAADWKDEELPQVWQINSPRAEDGKANLYDDGRRVWIDVSGFKAGESQGNLVYGIAAAYAHNNGKVFIGDPMGLSPVAFFRRLENMISSALRYGTTDHLAPHAAQTTPEKYFRDEAHNPEFAAIAKNFALDWKSGDFAHNLKAMLTTAYNAAKHYVPDLEHLTYDFDRREFVDTRTGEGRSGIDLARIFRQQRGEPGSPARYFGGSSTAARAALFNTLVQGTGKEGWSGVVAALGRQLQGDGLDPALKRIFYSRAGNPDDVKPGRAARIEAIINRGAKVLPEKMRTQVTEDSTRQIIGESNRDYTPAQREFFANTGRDIETPTLKAKIKSVWQDAGKKVAQGMVDQFAPIKDITEKGYMLARLSKGAAGAFNALLDHGKLSIRNGVYDGDQSGGVVERLFKPLQGEGEDFLWWVAANRAERLTGEGRENLFSGDDIAAGKSLDTGTTNFDYTLQHDVGGKAAGTVTRDRTLIYRDSAKVLDEFNRNVMDMAEQSGLIDGEARHIWEHDFYVPFYRVSDEDGSQNFANVKSGLVRQQAFKQLKGGSEKINADILSNVLSNWAHLIDASAKNRAAQETLSVAESLGIAHKAEPGEKNTVWYQKDGNKVEYKVDDPYLMTAINSLAYSGLSGPMINAMSAFKHALTVGVTSSPFFKERNLIRDSLQAVSTSGLSYNVAKNIKEGIKASDRKSQSYVSLLASGGIIKFGSMLEGNESKRVRKLVKSGVDAATILDSQNKLDAFYAKYIEPAIHAYHEIGERGEEINRAALYQQLLAQGVDHAKAAYEARDLMDFSMQGSWASIRLLTQVVPFMNARLQGLYKLGRAAKDDPRKLGIVLGSVALASIGLMLGYKDDDDWKKREDWDRDNYWWFKVGGEAFRIPKPFEIGAIGSLAERGVELFASDEMTRQRFMDRFTSLLSDNLSMNPIPQLVKPILDVYANKDGFTGRPIETMGMERMRPQDRYTASTSMIARGGSTVSNALTGVLGKESLSPVQIDEMIRGYFGWLGSFVLSSADQLARPASGEPSRPSMDFSKTLSGGMVASLDGASSRYVSQMYDQARTLEEAYGSWKQMLKEGKVDDAADYYADNAGQLALYKHVERTKADAAKLNQQLRSVENSDAAPDEKRDEINRIRDEQDQVARRLSTAR